MLRDISTNTLPLPAYTQYKNIWIRPCIAPVAETGERHPRLFRSSRQKLAPLVRFRRGPPRERSTPDWARHCDKQVPLYPAGAVPTPAPSLRGREDRRFRGEPHWPAPPLRRRLSVVRGMWLQCGERGRRRAARRQIDPCPLTRSAQQAYCESKREGGEGKEACQPSRHLVSPDSSRRARPMKIQRIFFLSFFLHRYLRFDVSSLPRLRR